MNRNVDLNPEVMMCSRCFQNEGLRKEAEKIGKYSDCQCPRCGSFEGVKLTRNLATELLQTFFCTGSRTSLYGFDQFCLREKAGQDETSVEFEARIAADYGLLSELTGSRLYWNAGQSVTMQTRSMIDEIHHKLRPPSPDVSAGMVH